MTTMLLAVLLGLQAPALAAEPAKLQEVKVERDKVSIQVSRQVAVDASRAEDPLRIILRFEETVVDAAQKSLPGDGASILSADASQAVRGASPKARVVLTISKDVDFSTAWEGGRYVVSVREKGAPPQAAAPAQPAAPQPAPAPEAKKRKGKRGAAAAAPPAIPAKAVPMIPPPASAATPAPAAAKPVAAPAPPGPKAPDAARAKPGQPGPSAAPKAPAAAQPKPAQPETFAAAPQAPPPSDAARLAGIEVQPDRVVLNTSKPTLFRGLVTAQPPRLTLRLENTVNGVPRSVRRGAGNVLVSVQAKQAAREPAPETHVIFHLAGPADFTSLWEGSRLIVEFRAKGAPAAAPAPSAAAPGPKPAAPQPAATAVSAPQPVASAPVASAVPAPKPAAPVQEPAKLSAIRVEGGKVIVEASQPVLFSAAFPTPVKFVLRLHNTVNSAGRKVLLGDGAFIRSAQATQAVYEPEPRAQVAVHLARQADFDLAWEKSTLVISFKPKPGKPAPAPAVSRPAAPPAQPPAPPAAPAPVQAPPMAQPAAPQPAPKPPAAAPPAKAGPVKFKGRLTDPAGNPMTGLYKLTFKLKDDPSWTETQFVDANDGLFQVVLGRTAPPPPGGHSWEVSGPAGTNWTVAEVPYWLQVASLDTEARARKLREELGPEFGKVLIRTAKVGEATYYRVLVGPFVDRPATEPALQELRGKGHQPMRIQAHFKE